MTPPSRYADPTTLPPFLARPTAQGRRGRRSAWVIGLVVAACVTAAGVVLGPVVAVVAFDLAPLYPLTLIGGAVVGGAYGLAAGVLVGFVTCVVVALVRASRDAGPGA